MKSLNKLIKMKQILVQLFQKGFIMKVVILSVNEESLGNNSMKLRFFNAFHSFQNDKKFF